MRQDKLGWVFYANLNPSSNILPLPPPHRYQPRCGHLQGGGHGSAHPGSKYHAAGAGWWGVPLKRLILGGKKKIRISNFQILFSNYQIWGPQINRKIEITNSLISNFFSFPGHFGRAHGPVFTLPSPPFLQVTYVRSLLSSQSQIAQRNERYTGKQLVILYVEACKYKWLLARKYKEAAKESFF